MIKSFLESGKSTPPGSLFFKTANCQSKDDNGLQVSPIRKISAAATGNYLIRDKQI